ncbi:dehydrase and lipid transport-domain-containing protein [Durotheca rogersii]|uniref:dehydrase and lipid transport-domain-containing protein n=1 Tax=Durotheca rogersii TaxID=419775 RepID=UPI00221F92FE|nr:dehydrase and lipid transport-domain-containing protein [Durotheca rogersii]KAI5862814.1 dehydrase and lipid transport-domain-containing protein [Durotheca rogersii]
MSTSRALSLRPRLPSVPPLPLRRAFITLPSAPALEPRLLTAARRLPYHHERLYELVADVDAYSRFLPYCTHSRVTRWSAPYPASPASSSASSPNDLDADAAGAEGAGRRWPLCADLTAGWGNFVETYTSRLVCVPALGVVEAVSGPDGRSELSAAERRRYGLPPEDGGLGRPGELGGRSGVFKSLVTRWTVRPAPPAADTSGHDWSDVRLTIKYQFANPLYMVVGAAVADKIAPVMVDAFVKEARRALGETGRVAQTLR